MPSGVASVRERQRGMHREDEVRKRARGWAVLQVWTLTCRGGNTAKVAEQVREIQAVLRATGARLAAAWKCLESKNGEKETSFNNTGERRLNGKERAAS